jgi:organic hydroperoxide reductase OsmC/OhrA
MPMETTTSAPPKPAMKHKTFSYHTALSWTDKRKGILSSAAKPSIVVSSPPEFKGEPGMWTPEDLFVAAVESCTMTTFLAFARKLELDVVSYESRSEGVLEFVDGGYRFTKVILRPIVRVRSIDARDRVVQSLHDAHHSCLIANSIRSEVTLEPVVEIL